MQILHPDLRLSEITRQVLRQAFRQRRHEHALPQRRGRVDLTDEMLHLVLRRPQHNLRINQSRGPDELFGDDRRFLEFKLRRGRRDVERLPRHLLKLRKTLRPVVQRRGQPEPKIHQRRLTRFVAVEHPADLRNGHVALVHHQEKILRKKIEQTEWPLSRLSRRQMSRVIFNAVAEAHFLQHLQIVIGPHAHPLRFQVLAVLLEERHALIELRADGLDRRLQFPTARHILVRRVEIELVERAEHFAGQRIELAQPFDVVAKKFHA